MFTVTEWVDEKIVKGNRDVEALILGPPMNINNFIYTERLTKKKNNNNK